MRRRIERYHIIASVCLAFLVLLIVRGIVKEAETSSAGFGNSVFYFYHVAFPAAAAFGLLPFYATRVRRFGPTLRFGVAASVAAWLVLGTIGSLHYKGLPGAWNWLYLFISNPFEVMPTLLLLVLTTSLFVAICYYLGDAGLDDDA